MVETISNTLEDALESVSQWFLAYMFSEETVNTGGSAFRVIFDKIVENVFSFKCILLVFGVMFILTIVRFIFSLVK